MEKTNGTKQKKLTAKQKQLRRFWREFRPVAVLLLSVAVVYFVARFSVNAFVDTVIDPVDKSDATPYAVTIPSSSSASSIARILYGACGYGEDGLITNTAVFKVYVDFVGKANSLKAGTYTLSKNMSVKQIVDVLCEGNPPRATVKFTVPEGYTVRDMAAVLQKAGFVADASTWTEACRDGAGYVSFDFIASVVESGAARDYALEGYLFPDTYEVFADAGPEAAVTKMLNRFNEIFTDEYRKRAETLGLSVDEVVTLASLIEREAQADGDFAKVSAVFHNRIRENMRLQSCASLSYVLGVNKYVFSEEELAINSPYNTYRNEGLPAGPICNPGKTAIEAALYPNEAYLAEDYLYFCNGNLKESSALVFAKTYEEHQENIEKYQQYWS